MNLSLFNTLISCFYSDKKAKFYLLFFLSLIAGLFEFIGLILIYQFVLFLTKPDSAYCLKVISFFLSRFNISDFSCISLIIGVTIALIYIFKNIYMLLFFKFSDNVLQDLNQRIIIKILKIFLFQDYLKIDKITNDEKMTIVSKVSFVVWQYCYKYVNLIANSCVGIILVLCLFIKFTFVAIFATLFISILGFIEYKFLKKNATYQNKHFSLCFSSFENIVNKTINNIKEIRLNNLEDEYISNVQKNSTDYIKLNKNRNFCSILHVHLTEISVMMTFIFVLILLFYTSNFDNQILMSSICTICVIILRLTPIVNRAQSCLYSMNSNECLVRELIEFDNKFSECDFSNSKEKMPFLNLIELKNVYFSYKDDSGLDNINLKINKNDFIGIVGKSGCYKSTLSLILAGLFKAQKGEMLVDNNVLDDKNRKKWQNNVALLGQDFSIIFDDLSHDAINFCKKMDIKTPEKELQSFGEKQRMALANILSTDKEVLILDEISSSADVISQEKINEILSELKGKKTIITIAHRFQILKNCDKIIYMDNAKVVDIGTFKELCEKYDDFKKMVELSSFEI